MKKVKVSRKDKKGEKKYEKPRLTKYKKLKAFSLGPNVVVSPFTGPG